MINRTALDPGQCNYQHCQGRQMDKAVECEGSQMIIGQEFLVASVLDARRETSAAKIALLQSSMPVRMVDISSHGERS